MTAFEYNPVDFDAVSSVTLISEEAEEYRSFLRSVYDSGEKPQYERRIENHPDVAGEYRRVAEDVLDDPEAVYYELVDEAVQPPTRVCGDCIHARNDEYRTGVENIVCWENQPPKAGRKPRKLETDSPFAESCDSYRPTDAAVRDAGYDPRLTKMHFLESLVGENGSSEQEKAALKFAYYQVWGLHGPVDTEEYAFNPAREREMLRSLGSDAVDGTGDLGEGGKVFEELVKHNVFSNDEIPDLDRVFRIELNSGETTYKEMDIHTRVDETPIIAELFTQRFTSKKAEQLADYERLYRLATGIEPVSYLVTEEVFTWEEVDGEFQRVELDEGRYGEISHMDFESELREMAGLANGYTTVGELMDTDDSS